MDLPVSAAASMKSVVLKSVRMQQRAWASARSIMTSLKGYLTDWAGGLRPVDQDDNEIGALLGAVADFDFDDPRVGNPYRELCSD
jgi:hypothetical protein